MGFSHLITPSSMPVSVIVIIMVGDGAPNRSRGCAGASPDQSPLQASPENRSQCSASGTADQCAFTRADPTGIMIMMSMAHFVLTNVTVVVAIADSITHAAIVVVSAIVLGGDTERKQNAHDRNQSTCFPKDGGYKPVGSSERTNVLDHHHLLESGGRAFVSHPVLVRIRPEQAAEEEDYVPP
jgi:hypothetical protein